MLDLKYSQTSILLSIARLIKLNTTLNDTKDCVSGQLPCEESRRRDGIQIVYTCGGPGCLKADNFPHVLRLVSCISQTKLSVKHSCFPVVYKLPKLSNSAYNGKVTKIFSDSCSKTWLDLKKFTRAVE